MTFLKFQEPSIKNQRKNTKFQNSNPKSLNNEFETLYLYFGFSFGAWNLIFGIYLELVICDLELFNYTSNNVHFSLLALLFTTLSINAMPRTPSSTRGKSSISFEGCCPSILAPRVNAKLR